jgi:hypothetical protein
MRAIIVKLSDEERRALVELARQHKRRPAAQAAWLLRRELRRRGLLDARHEVQR